MPVPMNHQVPIPPPSYQRTQAKAGKALHIDALTLVTYLHLLTLCRVAVQLAHHRCPPPLPKGPGGAPRRYSEESLLLVALLRTLWRLSYQDMREWLYSWPELAIACGFSYDQYKKLHIPSASQQWKRRQMAGAPLFESLFLVSVLLAIRCRLILSLIVLLFWLGAGLFPMQPTVTLQLITLVHFCGDFACIP